MQLEKFIRDVPDFPKEGILFKDITPLLLDPGAFAKSLERLSQCFGDCEYDLIVGPESRGFIFGVGLAQLDGKGFVPVRKPGKLPGKVESISYDLEYGTDSLEIHSDAISPGQRVLIIDDLLATGGTVKASCDLVGKLGGEVVGLGFLIELSMLDGRKRLEGMRVESLISY